MKPIEDVQRSLSMTQAMIFDRRSLLIGITERCIKTRHVITATQSNIVLRHDTGFKILVLPVCVGLAIGLAGAGINRVVNIRCG